MRTLILLLALWSAAQGAVAQSNARPDPTNPAAPAPVIQPQSAFADYQPFQEQKSNSWKQVNQEVADNPGMGSMGSMKDMPGKTMPGMDSKTADAPMSKEGAGDHDMDSMKDMRGKAMPGMDEKAATAPRRKKSAGGHDTDSMKDMPGKTMPGMNEKASPASMSKKGHDEMAMAKPQTDPSQPDSARTAVITGTAIVQGIDKANGKVKLTHDPIDALGWPKMTMFFRLKDSALADQVKEGDKVDFFLEKSASGYVISGFRKSASDHDTKQMK